MTTVAVKTKSGLHGDDIVADTYKIIQHDCEMDTHGYTTWGPFASRDAAETYIVDYDLWRPMDGGYAFAVVVLAEPGDTFDIDPTEWAEEMADTKGETGQ